MTGSGASHRKILLGLALGTVAGVGANWATRGDSGAQATLSVAIDSIAHPIGQVFLRMLFVVVLPLVFASIACGVASLGDLRKLGRLGGRTLGFFLLTSCASAVLGISALEIFRPGAGFDAATVAELQAKYASDAAALSAKRAAAAPGDLLARVNQILDLFLPRNLLASVVEMQMVPLIVFALLFGAALTKVAAQRREVMVHALEALADAMVGVVGFAMKLAPYAVFCLIFGVTARFGLGLLQKLGLYVVVILACYVVQLCALYPALIVGLGRRNPWDFLRRAIPVLVTALSTSSSSATLPTSIRVAETSLGIRPAIAGFVLPLGATMNMNGTALFEGAVVLFVAQVFGIDLTISTQALVVGLCVLTSIGAAGVPGGSLPLLMGVMAQAGVPPDGIAIILGVDRVLDMGRTVINVMGDLVCASYIEAVEVRAGAA
jgi:DAACS family dicarboxylate/amino acid:cation (Na+ or H+) symporter